MRALLAFLSLIPLMDPSHSAPFSQAQKSLLVLSPGAKWLAVRALIPGPKKSLGGLSSRCQKACKGEAQKPHPIEALCRGAACVDTLGVAVEIVPAEAICLGVRRRPKGLGAKASTFEAAYPSKGVTCATASAWVISVSSLSRSSRRYFQLPMPSSCMYES